MSQQYTLPRGRTSVRRLRGYFAVLAALLLPLVAPGAFAQTHVSNPFVGATQYVNPDYATEVNSAIATESAGSTIAKQMAVVATYPTAIWMDHIGAIAGSSTRKSLAASITAALAQQSGSTPIVMIIVIYDLPDRDCAALASNGELSIAGGDTPKGSTTPLTGTGLQEYEQDYITPIYNVLAGYKTNANIRFVLVIEPDSLPNLVTNTGLSSTEANCVAANNGQTGTASLSGVYAEGITYALNTFHALPNVYQYLDIGQSAWLGWTSNLPPAITLYHGLVTGATAGYASIDGFISNTANYIPVKEPFMTATEEIGGNPVDSSTFYQYNPEIDEIDYDEAFYSAAVSAGFPSTIGFLIDTSRNGWGGSLRPTAASTSTDLNTFVDASKLDERPVRGVWCNIENAGIGVPPTATPGGFANLEAYVWIKPPGEADGNYPGSVYNGVTSTTGDPNCNPANTNSLAGGATDSLPNSPPAGTFWTTEFAQLVQDAYPVIPSSTAAGFSISAAGVSVEQGTTATSSVTVSAFNGFNGTVALTVSGLPTGVTAAFSPASVTGSAGSTLTFTATNTATVGAATVTITGTSGSTTETGALTLTVVAEPNFTITVSPTTLSVPVNANPTVSLVVTYVGGLTGSVSLSASGLPTGVAANFAPSSFNSPGGASTVNFTSQTSTPAGTYNISLTGTDGSVTHSATLALTIPGSSNGFTLKSAATAVTVAQGKTATDTITVTDVGTFTGSVTLAASGLPTGVTATWGANPTTGSSVLTLTASSTATTGASTITITGTSGSTTATTTFTLSVTTSAAGFTLAPSPPSLSITQGKTATDTLTVTDVNGFTGSVTLAVSGLPSGVTVAFGANPTTSTSVLTFTASATATVGLSTVTITGTSGSTTATTTIALTVASSASSGCTIDYAISPQNNTAFGATITIVNGSTAITSWTLTWTFANGQTISSLWNGVETQSGANVTVKNEPYNGSIAANGALTGIGFNGTWNGTTNAIPTAFSLNGTACTVN
jgi:cellulose 1,4-beta-cellobiosidase